MSAYPRQLDSSFPLRLLTTRSCLLLLRSLPPTLSSLLLGTLRIGVFSRRPYFVLPYFQMRIGAVVTAAQSRPSLRSASPFRRVHTVRRARSGGGPPSSLPVAVVYCLSTLLLLSFYSTSTLFLLYFYSLYNTIGTTTSTTKKKVYGRNHQKSDQSPGLSPPASRNKFRMSTRVQMVPILCGCGS